MQAEYRVEIPATLYVSVLAESPKAALKLAAQAVEDYSEGCTLADGSGYTNAVLYTSREDYPEIVDIEPKEDLCSK